MCVPSLLSPINSTARGAFASGVSSGTLTGCQVLINSFAISMIPLSPHMLPPSLTFQPTKNLHTASHTFNICICYPTLLCRCAGINPTRHYPAEIACYNYKAYFVYCFVLRRIIVLEILEREKGCNLHHLCIIVSLRCRVRYHIAGESYIDSKVTQWIHVREPS